MKKLFLLILSVASLSACTSHFGVEKDHVVQANSCVYKDSSKDKLNIVCDDFTIIFNEVSSRVEKEQTYIPFQFKNVQWELVLEVAVKTTHATPLFLDDQSVTIKQASRLLSPIQPISDSLTTKHNAMNEQILKKHFFIKIKEYEPFILNGLKVSSGGREYSFDDIQVVPSRGVNWKEIMYRSLLIPIYN